MILTPNLLENTLKYDTIPCVAGCGLRVVPSSVWAVTSEDRERRHCVLWWLSRLCKCSAHMSLANHSGACGSEVRPPLDPTCTITGIEDRERSQETKTGNEDGERRKGKKKGNHDRGPRQGTKTGNQDRELRRGTKTGNQDGEPRLRTENRE